MSRIWVPLLVYLGVVMATGVTLVVVGRWGFGLLAVVLGLALTPALFLRLVRRFAADATTIPPLAIHLETIDEITWSDPEAARGQVEAFGQCGFAEIGRFRVPELGVELVAFVLPSESLYAVLYHHRVAGLQWMDVGLRYEDGGRLTVTSSPMAGALDLPEGGVTVALPEATPGELVAAIRSQARSAPRRAASAAAFVGAFEAAYAEEMEWRSRRGGPTRDEVRRVAERTGQDVSEEVLDAAHAVQAEKYREQRAASGDTSGKRAE